MLGINIILLLLIMLIMGLLNYSFYESHSNHSYIYEGEENMKLFSFKASLTYYLLFNQTIPISLIIVLEIAKLV
jgi:magnesium-transporting ATPase (P-type)